MRYTQLSTRVSLIKQRFTGGSSGLKTPRASEGNKAFSSNSDYFSRAIYGRRSNIARAGINRCYSLTRRK